MASPSLVQQAVAIEAAGRGADAVAMLEAAGTGDAALALALWRVEGRVLPRDLGAARDWLVQGVACDHVGAARILSGFLAAGRGGAADWAGAVALLERFAGRDPLAARQLALIAGMDLTEGGSPHSLPAREPLSETPAIWRVAELFSADECGFLIEAATQRFRPATIFHEGEGRFVRHPVRDSDSMGFPIIGEGPAVHALNRRVALATATEVAQGETLQILRYAPGQRYRPHLDAIPGLANQRVLTALVYLNDDYSGGETCFPMLDLVVRGRTGDALIFENATPDGQPDPATRHSGEPVTRGVKFLASRWIRAQPAPPGETFDRADVMR